jgi:peptidoglycan/xylan/chitin deacetylase (PgdA/CDA1 family)
MIASIRRNLLSGVASAVSPRGTRGRLSILIYHRVRPQDVPDDEGSVRADEFSRQMETLAEHFHVLALPEAVERLASGTLPSRAASVTFDDGYADNATVALPILLQYRVPATFFVATGYLNGGRMWNDTIAHAIARHPGAQIDLTSEGLGIHAIGTPAERRATTANVIASWKYAEPRARDGFAARLAERVHLKADPTLMMTTAQVLQLATAGMTIGAHTVSHPILKRLPDEQARAEIIESRRVLQEMIRLPVALFAYPNGRPGTDYSSVHVQMVREAGYSAAVSTAWGAARHGADTFQLPRFTPWDRTPARFATRLVRNLLTPAPATA